LDSRVVEWPWHLHCGFVTVFNLLVVESSIKAFLAG